MAVWLNSRRIVAGTFLTIGLMAGSPVYADFDSGMAAYDAGDYQRAMDFWRPLADEGDGEAQYWVGRLFEDGEGVAPSLARAAMWYRLAAGAGSEAAQSALDGVLETLRAREASQSTSQVADNSGTGGDGAPAPGRQAPAPDYEPDRDPATSAPGQVPDRDAAASGSSGAATGGSDPAASSADSTTQVAETGRAAAGAVDNGAATDAAELGEGGAAIADSSALDEQGPTAGDEGNAGAGSVDDVAIEAEIADARDDADRVAENNSPAMDEVPDPGAPAAENGSADDGASAGSADPIELAALDETQIMENDPSGEMPVEDIVEPAEATVDEAGNPYGGGPLPPELAEAMADGVLDADEIDALVEEGAVTGEMVDDLIDAGMLDESALAELVEAGVLDEAALDALVDNGLIEETLLGDAEAVLRDDSEIVADVGGIGGSVLDTIGDSLTRVFEGGAPTEVVPQRRLITARQ